MTGTDAVSPPSRPPVCIIQPRIGLLTETFIDAHYRHLGPPVFRLESDPFPSHSEDGHPLFSFGHPVIHRIAGRFIGLDPIGADRAVFRRLPAGMKTAALARHLRKRNVGVVLAEYGPTGATICDACIAAGVPLVVHFHGYDAYKHSILQQYRAEFRHLFATAAAIIAVSKHMKSQLIELGAPPAKVEYNPYGIDVDLFGGANPDRNPPTYLAVGRFVEKKAPHLTIRAFAGIARAHTEAELVMIGEGPLASTCAELAVSLGIDPQVKFLGAMPHEAVAAEMGRARCFVQHSITPKSGDMEGTPLAILEALASGLPVVATRHGGIVDVVQEGRSGYLVDEGDVASMAEAMAKFAADAHTASEFGAAGREYVTRHHTLKRRIARLESILVAAMRTPQSSGKHGR